MGRDARAATRVESVRPSASVGRTGEAVWPPSNTFSKVVMDADGNLLLNSQDARALHCINGPW